jgi:hypothetical protein
MDWSLAYFRAQARKWKDRRMSILMAKGIENETVGVGSIDKLQGHTSDIGTGMEKGRNGAQMGLGDERGHFCYTFKQEDMWLKFADLAQDHYSKARASQPN